MNSDELANHVKDPDRLAALRAVALLDTPAEEAFDRVTRLAVRFFKTPVSVVTLIDADRQFFKSAIGLPEPLQSLRESSFEYSFCVYNRIAGQSLVIEDARVHPLFKDHAATRDFGVVAYLGEPLVTTDGYVLGSFCVIDFEPRKWTAQDIEVVQDLAAGVMVVIQLRTEITSRNQVEGQRDELERLNSLLQQEIEARKEAEKQLHQAQKMEAIGRLAGGVAHDFNNLLSPILGYGELLAEDPAFSDEHRKYLNEILRAGFHARDLVRQLLAFSRRQNLELQMLNINHTIENFGKLLRRTIPEDIEIKTMLSPDVKPVMADAGQIEQIIMNLAVNAADAMPDGGRLTIETGLTELDEASDVTQLAVVPGLYTMLSVSDTGCGMDRGTREHIFEPFFSTKGDLGTGLGLATVFGIVKQHGGNIRIYSEPDEGSIFKIYFPVAEQRPSAQQTHGASARGKRYDESILLVEDNEQVRNLTRAILEQQGYTVREAMNGPEALNILTSDDCRIDLLLTDVIIPGMNGKQLYDKALQSRPGLKVLYMSGYTDDVIANRGVLERGTQFLTKPFSSQYLADKVREAIEKEE